MESSDFKLFGTLWDWTLGVFRSPVLWVPLVVFTLVGVVLGLWTLPADMGTAGQVACGAVFGVFSYLFPYANRVLDPDWV
ncbi:MAG: hypothetical protein EP330_16175 [Deltaproteobacteria bacterium]|nr:MAG: hypothetical protein EP330_16175 [Deltaproteobacteria bacterium]